MWYVSLSFASCDYVFAVVDTSPCVNLKRLGSLLGRFSLGQAPPLASAMTSVHSILSPSRRIQCGSAPQSRSMQCSYRRTVLSPAGVLLALVPPFSASSEVRPRLACLLKVKTMTSKLLSFCDLQELGVVNNRTQLSRLIENSAFPRGFLISARARRWPDKEVDEWVEMRRAESAGEQGP